MKINIIGPYPPPYGGISIHIKRLYQKLKSLNIESNIYCENKINIDNNEIKNLKLKKFILLSIFLKKNEIIHLHTSGLKIRLIMSLISFLFSKKLIITVHGVSLEEEYNQLNKFGKIIYKFLLNKISYLIVVNSEIKDWCIKNEILLNRIEVIPAYINPIVSKNDYLKINKEVWDFIENSKKRNEKIITGNGNIRFFNNEDLYGLDLLVELIYLLRKNDYKVSLFFALLGYESQSKKERNYFASLLEKIKEYHIEENIFIYKIRDTEYYPILDKTDIFIRPTNTDGDAISIREAIYLKKPNIASDIVKRPAGTILFKSREIKDLFKKVKYILDNFDKEKNKLNNIETKEYYEAVLEVYKKVYKGNKK